MSENTCIDREAAVTHQQSELVEARRNERGMVTIEYAVGALMVIALVGVIIAAITTGTFDKTVTEFIDFVMKQIQGLAKGKP